MQQVERCNVYVLEMVIPAASVSWSMIPAGRISLAAMRLYMNLASMFFVWLQSAVRSPVFDAPESEEHQHGCRKRRCRARRRKSAISPVPGCSLGSHELDDCHLIHVCTRAHSLSCLSCLQQPCRLNPSISSLVRASVDATVQLSLFRPAEDAALPPWPRKHRRC